MRMSDRLLIVAAPWFGAQLIRLIALTQRTEIIGEAKVRAYWDRGERVILSTWHDQLLLMVTGYRGPGAKILISKSKDGELIARTVAYFGQGSIRGSSSRGGVSAFRELLSPEAGQFDLAVTPDGPKGPSREPKDGVLQLARLSGRPVVPLAYVAGKGYRFASWDRFLLPYPFARSVFSYGQPFYLDRQMPMEECRRVFLAAMEDNQRRAEARLESYGVSAV